MSKPRYHARAGSGYSHSSACKIAAEANRMIDEAIPVTPPNFFKRASSKSSPIHKLFQWDQRKAAYEHNLSLARDMLGAVILAHVTTGKCIGREFYNMRVECGEVDERQYVRRDMLGKDARVQLDTDLWTRVECAVGEARSLGLEKEHPRWRRLYVAVKG
jgi:hypothetical protein